MEVPPPLVRIHSQGPFILGHCSEKRVSPDAISDHGHPVRRTVALSCFRVAIMPL